MDESGSRFAIPKLKYYKYLTLNVMMHVEYRQVYEFMFNINQNTRNFLQKHIITLKNGFDNDGLIPYKF